MDIDNTIEQAKEHCLNQDARFTNIREKVYRLLLRQEGAMGAYDLLDLLKQTEKSAKPATVYRALDFLLDLGLVHRIESSNAFVACHHFGCSHPVQLLICDSCGLVKEIQSEGISEQLETQAAGYGFEISRQMIEAHGLCDNCRK
jgi:Fur family zinc uptake transcriptional regulator